MNYTAVDLPASTEIIKQIKIAEEYLNNSDNDNGPQALLGQLLIHPCFYHAVVENIEESFWERVIYGACWLERKSNLSIIRESLQSSLSDTCSFNVYVPQSLWLTAPDISLFELNKVQFNIIKQPVECIEQKIYFVPVHQTDQIYWILGLIEY